MKKSKTEAKFFCESCGAEVPSKAKVCPVCGKFFASVRCPKCGRTGVSEDFIKGCPTCGYAMKPEELYPDEYSGNGARGRRSRNNKGEGDSSLPLWIYLVPVCILVALVIFFYSCYIK